MHRYFKTLFLSIVLVAFTGNKSLCQQMLLQQVPGIPFTKVYDLFIDSKGFLWVGHNGGVSKYDGISFTNYSNPMQSSLAVTGFAEDRHGRIWFNNFTGQIFYIENGRMNLLTGYESKNEPDFPNIGLFEDKLVATTKKGLFICDINTLKCHYETCESLPANGTASLSIFKNEVVVLGYHKWFFYKPGKGLKPAHFNKADSIAINKSEGELTTRSFNDTGFMACNSDKVVYKLMAVNDSLRICGIRHFKQYINSMTVLKNGYWINTGELSQEVPGNGSIYNHDLSCEAIDKQGHYWYGSLQAGLLSHLADSGSTKNQISLHLLKGDKLTCLANGGNQLLIGTGFGKLISYNPVTNRPTVLTRLFSKHNGISYIKMLDRNNVILGTADHTFIFNLPANKVQRTYHHLVIRQADTTNSAMIFATASGLIALPRDNGQTSYQSWKNKFDDQFKGFKEYLEADGPYKFLDYVQRTLAVASLPKENTIWAALKNGLYKLNNSGEAPYFVNNLPVFASCLATYNNQVIVGTINSGVLIINGDKVKHLSTVDGLLSDNIAQVKIAGKELLIYNSGLVQIFDLATFKIIEKYDLPGVNDGTVTDAEELNGQLFLANATGLYKVALKSHPGDVQIYAAGLIVNGRDTDVTNNARLRYDQNEIGVKLGIPSLSDGNNVIVKYRLLADGAAKWTYGKAGERNFKFEALSPGTYQFEAFAGYLQSGTSGNPVKINFTIMPPWWRTWWAISAMVVTCLLIVVIILRLHYSNIIATKKNEFEKKLAIEAERQRISSDMHDDIGASLSAIKLFTGNIKQAGAASTAIPEIYQMVSELSDRTREVIWSLNTVYDTLESLICFIDSAAAKLFEHSGIKIKTILPAVIPDCKIDNDKRRDVYLLVKEALHNVIKHSRATQVLLEFIITGDRLQIKIQDNGVGLPIHPNGKINGQGLLNMQNRVKNLNGQLTIQNLEGLSITLLVTF